MTKRRNNAARQTSIEWTTSERIAVCLPLLLFALAVLPSMCCQFNAVKFDFPASVRPHDDAGKSDANELTTRPAATQPARPSLSDRVINEDAVIDAVLDDLMREDGNR